MLHPPRVQRVHLGFGVVAAPTPDWLVTTITSHPARLNAATASARAGDPAEVLPAGTVALVLVEHAVAVEEQAGSGQMNWSRAS
jgi:hypothetical protein